MKQTGAAQITPAGLEILARGEEETARLGQILARCLPEGTIVGLEGTLGAGKTRLVQAIARAARCDRHFVASPTFVLVQQYSGDRLITHIDAYRVGSIREFLELGVEEYFEGPGIVLIEWADRVSGALPRARVTIQISIVGENERLFLIQAPPEQFPGLLERIQAAWNEQP
jgi:tRNA threonylcarbamoyladenosine biosynthesis protein TsaE